MVKGMSFQGEILYFELEIFQNKLKIWGKRENFQIFENKLEIWRKKIKNLVESIK